MTHRPTRRQFLRTSLLAAGSAGALALGQWRRLAQADGTATPEAGQGIELLGGDADVWAWQAVVRGRISASMCPSVLVRAGSSAVEAQVNDGAFSATVPMVEGANTIAASCEQTGASDSVTYTGKLQKRPTSRVTLAIESGHIVAASSSQPAENNGTPLRRWVWSARETNPEPLAIVEPSALAGQKLQGDVEGQGLTLAVPETDGEYYLALTVTDEQGLTDRAETYFVVRDGQAVIPDYDTENTAWVENTVVYGVIPRNFGTPPFQAVIDRLDALHDLGINALWLAPVNQSSLNDYGYAVVNYFNVDRRYGTNEDLRRLVTEAHARGIRVLMDFVPNHSSSEHLYFRKAAAQGQASHFWDFYARDEAGNATHYFNWTNLPNLNYDNPEVRRWMLEAFSFWVREFDVDGFRVDAAWGIRERRPDFWPAWRRELKRIKPDLLLLAEASALDPYFFSNGFDAAYDWTGELGHWAWQTSFENHDWLTYNLREALTNWPAGGYDPDALIFRFINNNDTGARFVTRYGPDMTRVATALLLTLPGIPCIYTGDEVGAAFSPYSDAGPIAWTEQVPGLTDYHKTLIHLRRETPSLHSRAWTFLRVEPKEKVIGYLRHQDDGSEPLLVLLNFFDEALDVTVILPGTAQAFAGKRSYTDLITGETVIASAKSPWTVHLSPMQALILR